MKVFIIGVADHEFQRQHDGNAAAEDFKSLLTNICNKHEFWVIAEELSAEDLASRKSCDSVARLIAIAHGCKHVFADPNAEERRALGIPDDDEIGRRHNIRWLDFFENPNGYEAAIAAKRPLYWPLREAEWLRRIRLCNAFPCLMIIGAAHIDSFSELLKKEDVDFLVLQNRWQPCT